MNKMKNCIYILLLLAVAFSAVSCVVEEGRLCPEPTRVLLVYMATDNNLAGYEQEKIQALRDGWTGNPNDRIIVYRDTDNTPARLMEISNLGPNDPVRVIATYGLVNSASIETFSHVVNDVKAMFPADSYGLLLFSHASGWLPSNSLYSPYDGTSYLQQKDDTRSIVIDGDAEMELKSFAGAIPDSTFDYIVFEACLMACVEVAYELRNKTPLIFASSAEILHPGFAPVYAASTPALLAGDMQGFGQRAFDHVLTYAENNVIRSATYSVIRTAGLEPLATFIRNNCDPNREIAINDIQHFDRLSGYRLFFDLEDYYGRLLDTDYQRAELSRLVAACVPWKAATPGFMNQSGSYNGFAINKHSGLTTYIPQTQFPGLNAAYDKTQWKQAI